MTSAAYTPITGYTTLIAGSTGGVGTFNDAVVSGPVNIGFNFQFDCFAYTQFSVTPSGYLTLGGTPPASVNFNNDLSASANYPVIAPWWDHQHLYDGGGAGGGCSFNPVVGVHYVLTGSAPNRILKIEFNTQVTDALNSYWWAGCGLTMNRYQVWLYEGTNNIEFRYGSMWASSGQPTAGTIGIGGGTTNFISVTPNGATATTSSAVSDNNIALHVNALNAGTVYTFSPCYMRRVGNGVQAPVSMAPGATLFTGTVLSVGSSNSYTPFTLDFPATCASHNYTLTISGPAATDYKWGATNNQVQTGSIAALGTLTPAIIFTPSAAGTRNAILTITDNTVGCSVGFSLAASGCVAPVVTQSPAAICPGGVQTINVFGNGSGPQTFTAVAPNIPIIIPSSGNGSPYPSAISVGALPASGVSVSSVTLSGISHTFPDDIDIVLVSPTGQSVILMSDAGGSTDLTGESYTFSDGAAATLSDGSYNPTGTYKCTNYGTGDSWPAPGPGTAPTSTTLSTFTGNPNGNWNIYLVDDAGGDLGQINGWSITFVVNTPLNAVFSPTTGLWLNAGLTVPYTGTPVNTVYASPAATSSYVVTDPTCPGSPATITVNVNPATTITTQPTSTSTVCRGSSVNFTVVANGTAPVTYQWQVSTNGGGTWTDLTNVAPYSNVTTATLNINPVAANMSTYQYRVVVTGGCGTATSNAATLTVDQISHVTVTATPNTMCSPGATTIVGTATGGVLTGGIGVIGSSGTINLAIPDGNAAGVNSTITLPANSIPNASSLRIRVNVNHTWVGDVKFTLTSPCGTTFLFDRPGVPASTFGNSDNLGTDGSGAPPPGVYTFDVAAATVIPEGTGGTGFIAPGSYKPSDANGVAHNWAGITFPCSTAGNWVLNVSDAAGGDVGTLVDWAILGPTSGNYIHSLSGPGTIVQNPSSGPNNSTGSFTVTNIPAGVQTYTFTSTDALGCSVSTTVNVTVNATPVVTITPPSATICAGGIQRIDASAVPTVVQSFTNGTNIQLPPVPGTSGIGDPYPSTINVSGLLTSGVTVRSVTLGTIYHTFPDDIDIVLVSPTGQSVILMSDAGGGTALNGVTYVLSDAAAAALADATFNPSGSYKPTNYGAGDNWPAPGPGGAPTATTLSTFTGNMNGTWSLYAVDDAGGDRGVISTWSIDFNTPAPVVFSPVTNLFSDAAATIPYTGAPTYTVWTRTPTTTTYTATATSAAGCVGTATITVTVNQLPAITVQPSAPTNPVCPGFNVNFSVTATGTGLTYQWQLSTDNGATWNNLVNGAQYINVTTSTMTALNVQTSQNGYRFRVIVSGTCPPAVTSNSVTLVVSTPPTITSVTTVPAVPTICVNGNISFTVAATGVPAPTIYQWQVSTDAGVTWTNLTTGGSYTPTFTITGATAAMNNNRYRVIVTNSCGQSATSASVTLTVNALPTVTATALTNRICLSDTLVPLVGSPVGGFWSGPGVSGSNFIPSATGVGTYTLTYSYSNAAGCTATATVVAKVEDCAERIRLLRDNGVILFPNPNNGSFYIKVNSTLYKYLGMRVYNTAGQVVKVQYFNSLVYGRVIPIDLRELPGGTYMVKFYYDDGIRTSEKTFPVVISR